MKRHRLIPLSCLLLLFSVFLFPQEPYKVPPKEVVDIVTAPPPPRVSLSPDRRSMLLVSYESMPSIAYLAQPLLRIGGLRILPKYNARQVTTFYTGIAIKNIPEATVRDVSIPPGSLLGFPRWSHDSRWLAFLKYGANGVELWVAERESGRARKLTGEIINATLTSGFLWHPDNRHILTFTIPEGRGAPPEKPAVPVGPNIQETSGKVAKVWTYQDLLQSAHDEDLFEYYTTSQIVEIDVETGKSHKVGQPGMYLFADPSPNGTLLLVHRIKRPFSYMVPYYYFTHTIEVWNRSGEMVHLLADLPLADDVPMRGVPKGPRSFAWRPLKPATLVWVEALDEGDPEKQVPHRDRLMTQAYPFTDPPREIMKITHRYSGLLWMHPPGKSFLTEYDWKRRWRTTYLVDVDHPEIPPVKVFDLNVYDRYNDPGSPVMTRTSSGGRILVQDKDWIYLSGSGASPEGDRPFLDRFNLKSMEKERLFQCREETYEFFVDFFGDSRTKIITQYQSKTEPPNYFLVDLKSQRRTQLTDNKDPAPQMTGMKKQLIKYERKDGVKLSGTLYLPPDYKKGERLPLVVWAYPREYTDPRVAGQVRGSPHRFTYFRGTSQLFFVTQGYAVFDGAQMPIVGDPKTWNDTFVDQLVSSAKAAIDVLDAMGVIDPRRVGVGGHSYGAFMTANLLAHSDLFSAGIARSGAYNRTLTPFGFQNERRTLWEAPELYFKISPFMHADKINEPILLIHGEADNNSGTFPIQSRRLYHALKGHGATARLVMLPFESHGYRAKESVLHVLAEMFEWFDKYVKQKQ
ncbi:MAG: S9 family peptidase [Candidatus Aminicenantales bacterium]